MLTYDSFREIVGVATAERTSPVLTPRSLNMEFRDGIKPRFGLAHMQTVFEDEADRELFENGVVQKLHPYQRRTAGRSDRHDLRYDLCLLRFGILVVREEDLFGPAPRSSDWVGG